MDLLDLISACIFRYTNLKEESEGSSPSIQISNAEPLDSIVDGAGALTETASTSTSMTTDENFYSVPAVSIDNALTEYVFVKEVKYMAKPPQIIPKPKPTSQQNNQPIARARSSVGRVLGSKPEELQNSPDFEIARTSGTGRDVRTGPNCLDFEIAGTSGTGHDVRKSPNCEEGPIAFQPRNLTGNDPDLEIYSAASTLSLGETVILSDGWINRTSPNSSTAAAPPGGSNRNNEGTSESDFILTLDVDTTASVI